MKTISSTLKTFLLSSGVESCYVADLFLITLLSGQVLCATDAQMPVTWNGNTYDPVSYGAWKLTNIETAIGTGKSTAKFTIFAGTDLNLTPFDIPLLEAIQLGLFDGADIVVNRVWMPVWGDIVGNEVKYGGQIASIEKTGRTTAEGTAAPFTFKLNQPMPRHVLQPGCRWVFGSPGCTVNRSSFTYTGSVSAISGPSITPVAAITLPTGVVLDQGVITFTSGQNQGLSVGIQTYAGGVIRLMRPPLLPVAVGDTFAAVAGCAHTVAACAVYQPSTFRLNYGGQPYIPDFNTAL